MDNLFYSQSVNGNELSLAEQEAVHCSLVLRKKPGDIIYVIDGKGNTYKCGIDVVGKRDVQCTILSSSYKEARATLTLAVAPTKNRDRLEWIVEKVVELGVKKVVFLSTSRTERTKINIDRIYKKAVGAMKQSLRVYLPAFEERSFNDIVGADYEHKIIAHCIKGSKKLKGQDLRKYKDALILIGPEGDFTNEEVQQAEQAGFMTLDLGDARLRTETAAIAVAVLANS